MKRREREFEIFSLSFLDVISCGFAAVLMLILIFRPSSDIASAEQTEISSLLTTLISLENNVTAIQQDISAELAALNALSDEQSSLAQSQARLQQQLQSLQQQNAALTDNIAGLSLVESRLRQASLASPRPTPPAERSEEVGGIPVDSDYVIFVIDTSGSMKQIWPRVSREVINVLNIHPQVRGFQILNDMGTPLISGYDGQWMSDTPSTRNSAIRLFQNWSAMSNSSPVEGIETALRRYARPNLSTAIYVFGDDYTGGSFDTTIERISQMNRVGSSGNRLAKIHGVGFISVGTTDRFGVLMRELAKRNGGTYLGLPP